MRRASRGNRRGVDRASCNGCLARRTSHPGGYLLEWEFESRSALLAKSLGTHMLAVRYDDFEVADSGDRGLPATKTAHARARGVLLRYGKELALRAGVAAGGELRSAPAAVAGRACVRHGKRRWSCRSRYSIGVLIHQIRVTPPQLQVALATRDALGTGFRGAPGFGISSSPSGSPAPAFSATGRAPPPPRCAACAGSCSRFPVWRTPQQVRAIAGSSLSGPASRWCSTRKPPTK